MSDQLFLNRIQEENKDKNIFIIHNLKTFTEINEVENYIENTLLKLLSFRLQKCKYILPEDENNNNVKKENRYYYIQIFENKDEKFYIIIHLFMANDGK